MIRVLRRLSNSIAIPKMDLKPVCYIEPSDLKTLILHSDPRVGDYLVVDVRDNDHIGGHIKGSLNLPAHEFMENKESILKKYPKLKKVIFHCALSQVRGPKSARRFWRYLADNLDENKEWKDIQVLVLRGGFTQWQALYGLDPLLTSDYDQELWSQMV